MKSQNVETLLLNWLQLNLSNTGQSEVSVLERCSYNRGHYDDVTFMTFHFSTYSFKCSVAKTRLTLIFKLHLNFLIYSTKALSFSSMQHCTSQLQSKYRLDKSLF